MRARDHFHRCQDVRLACSDSSLVENHSIVAGFLITLYRILDISLAHIPSSSLEISRILEIFHTEFQYGGGLRRDTVLRCLGAYDPELLEFILGDQAGPSVVS